MGSGGGPIHPVPPALPGQSPLSVRVGRAGGHRARPCSRDRIVERHGNRAAVECGSREGPPPSRTGRTGAKMVSCRSSRCMTMRVGWSGGGLNGSGTSIRPVELHSRLVPGELCRAGYGGCASAEIEHGGGEAIGRKAPGSITITPNRQWLAAEEQPRHGSAVTPPISSRPRPPSSRRWNVDGIVVVVTEDGCCARCPGCRSHHGHEVAHALPGPVHEGFHDDEIRPGARRIAQRSRLGGVQPDRFLAEHVLAHLDRAEQPSRWRWLGNGM